MDALNDGTYDVVVIDAYTDPGGATLVELALMNCANKGDVIKLQAVEFPDDPVKLLGLPGTLTVTGGTPSLSLDRT